MNHSITKMTSTNSPHRRFAKFIFFLLLAAGLGAIGVQSSSRAPGEFSATASLATARRANGLTLLPDGKMTAQQPNATAPRAETSAALSAQVQVAYGKLPLAFEMNRGQTDEKVSFIARTGGATIFLTPGETVFALRSADPGMRKEAPSSLASETGSARSATAPPASVLRMKLAGANPQPAATGLNQQAGTVNYFKGNDAAQWHTNIPTFGKVRYTEVYPGVDMIYYGNQRQLEYDLVVSPGADTGQIALSFEGAEKVSVEAGSGDLLLETKLGTIRQRKPVVYQEVGANGMRSRAIMC